MYVCMFVCNFVSNHILVHVGLAGKSRVEQARANMIVLSIEDALYRPSGPILSAPDDTTRVLLITAKYRLITK